MTGLQLFFYVSLLVFVVGTAYKAVKIARMPLHLRWDLYPIPHEKGKGAYGGSYFEEPEWWTKPARVSILSDVREMSREVLFIQSLYHHNRKLWWFSFPFHFGLYLSIGFVVLMFAGAIVELAGVPVDGFTGSVPARLLHYLTVPVGLAGAALGLLGAIGLLLSRIFKYELRATSAWSDYFNLLLIGSVFATLMWTWATVDPWFLGSRALVGDLVAFRLPYSVPAVVYAHFLLAAVFMFWLPFTHMTHFVGKYFTYHKIRWEDHPNLRGSELEKKVEEALGHKISWEAPHIKSGGSWAEAAADKDQPEKQNNG